jgi:putative DNA primase/helicase
VIDTDEPDALVQAVAEFGELPETFTVVSGREGGLHSYFYAPEGFEPAGNSTGQLPKGIDVRAGKRGFVVGFGSVHPSGTAYSTETRAEIAELPAAWTDALREPANAAYDRSPSPARFRAPAGNETTPYGQRALNDECGKVREAVEGQRHNVLLNASVRIGSLIAGGEVSEQKAPERLAEAGRVCGLGEFEIRKTITDALAKGMESPRSAPPRATPAVAPQGRSPFSSHNRTLDDVGNGQRLVDLYGDVIHWVLEWESWVVWNKDLGRWKLDLGGIQTERFAKTMTDSIFAEGVAVLQAAQTSTSEDKEENVRKAEAQAKRLTSHWRTSRAKARVEAAMKFARSEDGIAVTASQLDAHPLLLNVTNGTLDLETLTLRNAEQTDLLTKTMTVAYDPAADCPIFLHTLRENLEGDAEVEGFLKRAAGLALLGKVEEHVLLILHGEGGNGKGLLAEILLHLFGDQDDNYGWPGSTDLLIKGHRAPGAASPEVAKLKGKRLVIISETGDQATMDVAKMKRLTGGDTLEARELFQNPSSFAPSHLILFHTNDLPKLGAATDAVRRRIRQVEFRVKISEEQDDKGLPDKLKREANGIFRWALEGLRDYYAMGGLRAPKSVLDSSNKYVEEGDPVLQFLKDECERVPEGRIGAKELYLQFETWARETGERAMPMKAFNLHLERLKIVKKKTNKGYAWIGVRVPGFGSVMKSAR